MSATYTDCRADICQHVQIRMGCLACSAEDALVDLREANSQKSRCLRMVEQYKAYLVQPSELTTDQKLAKEEERSAAWDERAKLLQDVAQDFTEAMRVLCASRNHANGSAELAEQFEADAVERAFSLELIWQASVRHEHVKFVPEDPACSVSFTGLDRSNILASPDWIVTKGLGFSVFLKSTKATRRPWEGLGPQPAGPAIMSYGRAISEFGSPEPLGYGPSSEPSAAPSSEQLPAPSNDDVLAAQVGKCHLGTKKPVTERELRLARGDAPPTAPAFKEDILWSMFGAGKFMSFSGTVVRHYAKLVAQRIAKDDRQKQEEGSATATADASTGPAIDPETDLPVVEGLDYNGLTNWLCRCLIRHKDFLHVTQRWDRERNARNQRVLAKIKEWKPPMDFEDGHSGQPDPRDFYNGPPLGQVDQAKLGIIVKSKNTSG